MIYSPYQELYTYIQFTFKNSESGSSTIKTYFCHIDKEYYKSSGAKLFSLICQIVFVFFLLLLISQQPFRLYNTYKQVKSDFEDTEITSIKYNKKFADILKNDVKNPGLCSIILGKIKLVIWTLVTHLANILNFLSLACIIISIIDIVYWIKFIIQLDKIDIDDSVVFDPHRRYNINDNVMTACSIYEIACSLSTFNIIIIYLCLLRCLSCFSSNLSILFNTIDAVKYEIIFFLIILISILLSFTMLIFLFFGTTNKTFSSIDRVITVIFQFMNWWYEPWKELNKINVVVGTLIFVVYIIVILFIFTNYFVGFMKKGYMESKKKIIQEASGRDNKGKKIKFDLQVHLVNQIRDSFYFLFSSLSMKFKRKLKKIKNDREKYRIILNQTKNESEKFDKDFEPLSLENKKNQRMSSHMEKNLKIIREKKYGQLFYSALIFFAFIAVYIGQLFQELNSKYTNDIGGAAQNRTLNNLFGLYDNQHTCDK